MAKIVRLAATGVLTCLVACGGGELRDLSTVSISDFFKSLATPERK